MNHPNRKNPKILSVVCVGGTDSSGGAGVGVDARALTSLGVPFKNIITAVTAQEHGKFIHLQDVSGDSIKAQAASVLKESSIVKIGMLSSSLSILNELLDNQTIILDPIIFSSSGSPLININDLEILKKSFLAKVTLITPNILEAEFFWGKKIESPEDVEKAAEYIKSLGARNVLIKGGHLNYGEMGDFFLGEKRFWIKSNILERKGVRGTGCAQASAIAAGLSLGLDLFDSLIMAKIFLHKSYRESLPQGEHYYLNPKPFHQDLSPCDMPWVQESFEDLKPFPVFKQKNKPTLYPIVDRAHWIETLAPAKPELIQLRIKDLEGEELEEEVKKAILISKKYGISLFINDFWQLAVKHGAFGVHLGQEDLDLADLSFLQEKGIRLGISTHCYFEAARALSFRPSYIAFGPIYHTALKSMDFAPQGLDNLRLWRDLFDLPLVAIGGINLDRGSPVAQTGVDIISVVRDILLNPSPVHRTHAWNEQIR